MSLEKDFVPYEQALDLKELGFDEPCLCFVIMKDNLKKLRPFLLHGDFSTINMCTNSNQEKLSVIVIPTFSQAFRWFREKYELHSHVRESYAFDNTLEFVTQINGSYVNHGIADKPINRFETYEEADLERLRKLIKIVKEKQNEK